MLIRKPREKKNLTLPLNKHTDSFESGIAVVTFEVAEFSPSIISRFNDDSFSFGTAQSQRFPLTSDLGTKLRRLK